MHLQALAILLATFFAAPSLKDDAANAYCNSHRAEWVEIWQEYGVPCDIAEAVIFPELIRYSTLQDKVETGAVRSVYISKGSDGCDFSIGRFQMKPSFVENLEKRWMRSGLAREYNLYFDTKDNEMARKVRISRLEKEEWQCIYLAVFLKMLYLDYGSVDKQGRHMQDGLETLPADEQVRLAATAYNRGCRWTNPGFGPLEELQARSHEKHFHTAVVPTSKTRLYVYGDIALKHFREIANFAATEVSDHGRFNKRSHP